MDDFKEPIPSELDFDSFLQNTLEQAERESDMETLGEIALQKVVSSLQENGVPLLVFTDDATRQASQVILTDLFIAENVDRLSSEYGSSLDIQDAMSFEAYVEIITQYEIDNRISLQKSLILIATASLITQDSAKPSAQNHHKKSFLASQVVQGRLTTDSGWFNAFNEVMPGDTLNPENPDDQHYFVEALEKYAREQSKRDFMGQISTKFDNIVTPTFSELEINEDEIRKIRELLLDSIVRHHLDEPTFESGIDELTRSVGASKEVAEKLKQLARIYTQYMTPQL